MIVSFDEVGAIGVIKDLPAHEIPDLAWTDCQNVRFNDGSVEKFKGHIGVYESSSASPTIQVAPYWIHPVVSSTDYFWLYAGINKVYATDGTTHTDLSASASSTVSANATTGWNGGMLGGGLLVINNGNHAPLVWGDNSAGPALSKPLQILPNWPNDTRARIMRVYREYLVAMDVTESGVRDRTMVWWSDPAEPRQVPPSWDYTDPTTQSGRYPLTMDKGYIVDGLPLRDAFMVYKEYSTWGMQWIGGTEIMRFFRVFSEAGMMSEDCAVDVFGRHIVLGLGDVYQHDGQSAESILTKSWKRTLYNEIDSTYYRRSFVVHNVEYSEVWFCYVLDGTNNANTDLIQPNRALVWNYRQNTFGLRDLPNTPFIVPGIPSGLSSATFDSDAGSFDSAGDTFDDVSYRPQRDKLIACLPGTSPRLLQMDYGELLLGATMDAYVERKYVPIYRQGRDGGMRLDLQTNKFVRRVYPRISGSVGGQVDVYIGFSPSLGVTPTYNGPYTYTIGSDVWLNVFKRGRILSIKVVSGSDITWKLSGYDLDLRIEGWR